MLSLPGRGDSRNRMFSLLGRGDQQEQDVLSSREG